MRVEQNDISRDDGSSHTHSQQEQNGNDTHPDSVCKRIAQTRFFELFEQEVTNEQAKGEGKEQQKDTQYHACEGIHLRSSLLYVEVIMNITGRVQRTWCKHASRTARLPLPVFSPGESAWL
jgi:hypothetical protein